MDSSRSLHAVDWRISVDERRRAVWSFKCDCGGTKEYPAISVRCGHVKSCGCMLKEQQQNGAIRHGKTKSPAWRAWRGMKSRCLLKSMGRYKNYGGRGITFCGKWNEFEGFYEDMGDPPDGFTLERDNVHGDYCKDNCKWIPPVEQYFNKTNTIIVSLHGNDVSFCELVRLSGLKYETAYARLKTYKWPIERVFANIKPDDLRRYTNLKPEDLHR